MARRLAVSIVTAAVLAVAATAASAGISSDGTLSLSNVSGTVEVKGQGALLGTGNGTLRITAPNGTFTISGALAAKGKGKPAPGTASGQALSFRVSSDAGAVSYSLRIQGTGISISVAGRAVVTVTGAGTADDGSWSLNGGSATDVTPSRATIVVQGAPPPGPSGASQRPGSQSAAAPSSDQVRKLAAAVCAAEAAQTGRQAFAQKYGASSGFDACMSQQVPAVQSALSACQGSGGGGDGLSTCVASRLGLPAPGR